MDKTNRRRRKKYINDRQRGTKRKGELLQEQIEVIWPFRDNNDLPSILKEFGKISRKPFLKISEIKMGSE